MVRIVCKRYLPPISFVFQVTFAFRRLYTAAKCFLEDKMAPLKLPPENATFNSLEGKKKTVDYLAEAMHHNVWPISETEVAVKVGGDGHCFYRALSLALTCSEDRYLEFRLRIALHAILHFNELVELQRAHPLSLDIDLIREGLIRAVRLEMWSNNWHCAIAAQVFGCTVYIVSPPIALDQKDPMAE